MIPVPHGGAASWFASLFGGTGQPAPVASAPADSVQAWSVFAAQLASVTTVTTDDDASTTGWPAAPSSDDAGGETDAGDVLATAFGLTPTLEAATTGTGGATPTGSHPTNTDLDAAIAGEGVATGTRPAVVVDASSSTTSVSVETTPAPGDTVPAMPATASTGHESAAGSTAPPAVTHGTNVRPDGTSPADPEGWFDASTATGTSTGAPSTQPTTASVDDDGSFETTESGLVRGNADANGMSSGDDGIDVTSLRPDPADGRATLETVTTSTSENPSARPAVVRPETPVTVPSSTPVIGSAGDPAIVATGAGKAATMVTMETPGAAAATRADEAVTEAITRMRVERHAPATRNEGRPALDLGSRVRVRPADATTVRPAPTNDATTVRHVRTTDGNAPQESILETITDELLEDEAAHDGTVEPLAVRMTSTAAGADTEDEVGRTRAAAHAEEAPTTAPDSQRATASVRAAQPIGETQAPDLGARLRQAVVEALASQAKDELLASAKDGWETRITVEPLQLGRVDVQVTQTPRGLEIILAAVHHEAARALEAEVDDLVDELVRRDFEPARVTVRSNDNSQDGDRPARNAQDAQDGRGKRTEDDDDAQTGQEGRRGQGRERQQARQQQAQA